MIYLKVTALVVCALLISFKINLAYMCYMQEEKNIKKCLTKPVGMIAAALWLVATLVAVFLLKVPEYYIQLADLIITLIIIAIVDFKHHIIPNMITLALLASQLLYLFLLGESSLDWLNAIFSLVVLLVLILISRMSKEQLGMGDVKLIATLNLVYGLSFTIYSMLLSMIVMLFVSIPLLIIKKINLKSSLPFVPFYAVGSCMFILFNFI